MRRLLIPLLGIAVASIVVACGGGGDQAPATGPRSLGASVVQGVGAGTNFGFDLGLVVGNRYYVTDRNNAAVDVFDTANSTQVGQIKGTGANAFAGLALKNGAVDNS